MKKGIIYVRVSSADQTQGTSLDSQERACQEYALKNGIEIVQVFIEKGESATATTRTEFIKALEFCRKHTGEVTTFLVWKIDRFARNTTDHFAVRAKLTQQGITLQSVTEPITQDHIGKLMETFLAGYAEFENEVRKQRCTGGMQARLREGVWCWSPPIGYTNSKKIKDRRKLMPDIPDEERFYLIQKGLRLYMKGNHTITALAEESERWGLKTRTGKPMRKQLWDVILVDKFYAGILVDPWTGEEYKGLHTPMITHDEYERIQQVKRGLSNNATAQRLSTNPDFPLRRFVLCECGRFYTASWSTGRNKKYPIYHCHNKNCLHFGHSIPREMIEQKFYNLLSKVSPVPEFISLFKYTVIDCYKEQRTARQQEVGYRERELKRLEARRKELLDMRINHEVSKEEYKEMKDALDSQISVLTASTEPCNDVYDMETAITHATKLISNIADEWNRMKSPKKERFQKMVLPKGITYQKTVGKFGTAILSPIFKLNETFLTNPSDLVAGAGIEPAIFRL
jgi:site-specific DNA recombinase